MEEKETRRDGMHSFVFQRYWVGWRPREGNNPRQMASQRSQSWKGACVLDPGCADTWGVSPWAVARARALSLSRAHTSGLEDYTPLTHILGPGVRIFREAARGVHDERSVLLEHAKNAGGPRAAVQPQHDGGGRLVGRGRRGEPVVELHAGLVVRRRGVEEPAVLRRRRRAVLGEGKDCVLGRGRGRPAQAEAQRREEQG